MFWSKICLNFDYKWFCEQLYFFIKCVNYKADYTTFEYCRLKHLYLVGFKMFYCVYIEEYRKLL